jgi:putative endonuclease
MMRSRIIALSPKDYPIHKTGYYFYVLHCNNGAYYTGIARDVAARWALHVAGRGAKYTRMHRPDSLCFVMLCENRSAALKAEYAFKQYDKPTKIAWLATNTEDSY